MRPLALLSVGLVLVTMAAVAVVAHAIVPGMSWAAAFVLGAIVGADRPRVGRGDVLAHRRARPRAAARRGRGDDQRRHRARRLPRRARRGARGHVLARRRRARVRRGGGRRRARRPGRRLGGAGDRAAPGRRGADDLRHASSPPTRATSSPRSCTSPACSARWSRGIYSRLEGAEAFDAETRLAGVAFWRVITLGLEALLFVLLGLQAPQVAEEIDIAPLRGAGAGRRARRRRRSAWRGRCCRPLAPATRCASGSRSAGRACAARSRSRRRWPCSTEVDERPEILLITFGVIAVTLLGQGLTLPLVLRALRLPGESRWSPDEALRGWRRRRRRSTGSTSWRTRAPRTSRWSACASSTARASSSASPRSTAATAGDGDAPSELRRYGDLRRDADRRGAARRCSSCAATGRVPPDVLRRVERDLDLEEARLRA